MEFREISLFESFEVSISRNAFFKLPAELLLMTIKSETIAKVSLTPFKSFPLELPCFPVKMKRQSSGTGNR